MSTIEVKVPDIGDFDAVRVIELLVKVGDRLVKDQSLITVESDKASMEIPSSHAGVVHALRVKLGDQVKQGCVIAELTCEADPAAPAAAAPAPSSTTQTSPQDAPDAFDCDVVVLGGGPGGYSAAFRAADLGLQVVLVERYPTLGGVCLNVGCIPSKALLHVVSVLDEVKHFAQLGVSFDPPKIDRTRLLEHKNKVVSKLTGGLAAMAKMRKVQVLRGYGTFVDANHLQVEHTDGPAQQKTGTTQALRFKRAIIAVGSQAVHLPFLPNDPRVVDSTGALSLGHSSPKRMLVLGGGIIGLEMGTVYSTLGARLDVVEMMDGLMPGADRDLVKVWEKINKPRFDRIMLRTKVVGAEATPQGIAVRFESADPAAAAACADPQTYDLVLQAVGRTPNGKKCSAERAGVAVTAQGFIEVDTQMRTNVAHIFAIGDVVGQPMLAHKAVHEAHVAAEVVAAELLGDDRLAKTAFNARVIASVAYTDPEVAWVGLTEEQAKAQGLAVHKGLFPWSASGRAIANGRDEGFTKLLFDAATDRIVGGGIVGTHAGDMIGEVALAIEMGATQIDIGKTIHPHPTLGESIGMAAEVAHGTCTDVPPQKKSPPAHTR